MKKFTQTLVTLVSFGIPGAAMAGVLGQATTPVGGVFVNACAGGQAFGGKPWPGDAFNGGVTDQNVNCNNQTSAVGGSASQSATNSGVVFGNSFSNTASASASPGLLHLGGSNNASNGTQFAGSAANVGFNDSLTVGGGSGTGILVLPFFVDGTLSSIGPGSASQLWITDYENFSQIDAYGANTPAYNLFNSLNTTHNGDILSSWDREAIAWGAAGDDLTSINVNQLVFMTLPVTFGQSFEFGIYAETYMSQNSGQSSLPDIESANFLHTIAYAGGAYVVQGSNTITDITFSDSASGIDYTQSLVTTPEPTTIALLLFGVAGLAVRLRATRS